MQSESTSTCSFLNKEYNLTKINYTLTKLPYEVEEIIMEYLTSKENNNPKGTKINCRNYNYLIGYSQINKRAAENCDIFFRRRARIDKLPLELLPKKYVTNRYIKLYNDKCCINNTNETNACIKKVIDNNDIEEVKWLISLVISNVECDKNILMGLSNYAFEVNNDTIGKWLLSNLHRKELNCITEDFINRGNIKFNMGSIINNCINKNRQDIIYYIVDEYKDLVPEVMTYAFSKLAIKKDLDNLNDMINIYHLEVDVFDVAIVNTNDPIIVEFLLTHYPGNQNNINNILTTFTNYYPVSEVILILFKYGYNDYETILDRISSIVFPCESDISFIEWLLLNHRDKIRSDFIKRSYHRVYNGKMRETILAFL